MNVLARRTLHYVGDVDVSRTIGLTIFRPIEAKKGRWKCEFVFEPPIYTTAIAGGGVDAIHAFLVALKIARIYLDSAGLLGQVHWRGMLDCGLLSPGDRGTSRPASAMPPLEAAAATPDVFATRRLASQDDGGAPREVLLTVFMPTEAGEDRWICGFALGPPPDAPVRYGVGRDALEALLDALAGARAIFALEVPSGLEVDGYLLDCADLPYKIGSSFWTDIAAGPQQNTLQVSG